MSLSNTPSAQRTQIAFFGKRNAGKSSLINAFSGQELSIVSDLPGTTTDPVKKTMEVLPLGPVVLVDTPGLDDEGEIGTQRIRKARKVLRQTDIAILVVDATIGMTKEDWEILSQIKEQRIPCLAVFNKTDVRDLSKEEQDELANKLGETPIFVSAVTGAGIHELKEIVGHLKEKQKPIQSIVSDLLQPKDAVILVIPIDASAPKGRLILPQQLVLRDLLDHGMMPLCCRETELAHLLQTLATPPAMVITDSQVFHVVAPLVPQTISLTSFSVLMARHKGTLSQSLFGANQLASLTNQDHVLIAEGCTHHRQCEDIGTVKLPRMIFTYAKAEPTYHFCSGNDYPEDLSFYRLVIHCGGCMQNEKEMQYRYDLAKKQGVPITNYGTAIAMMQGILSRAVAPVCKV